MAYETLIKSLRRKPLVEPGATTRAVALDRRAIERLVPHRPPFLLVDRLSAVDLAEQAAIGHRHNAPDDPVFAGHFPGQPIYPGVLLLEAMGQLCLCLHALCAADSVELPPGGTVAQVRLLRVHHALFLAETRPGDALELHARIVAEDGLTATMAGQVLRGDTICANAVLEAYLPQD